MSKKLLGFSLGLVLLMAILLRFYELGTVPVGLNRDEASIGYTAYSLLTTGRDEYGRFFPLSLESFGDWKLPLYVFATIPAVKLFSLTEFAVRFVSATSGVLSVILLFFLARKIYPEDKYRDILALISAALFAFLPWSVFFSRAAYEANFALALFLGAVLSFYDSDRHRVLLVLSALLMAATLFSYHASHVFIPAFLVIFLFLQRKNLPRGWLSLTTGLVFIVLWALSLLTTLTGADVVKISGIGLLSDRAQLNKIIDLPRSQPHGILEPLVPLLHNRLVYMLQQSANNYLNFFSPQFLVEGGGTNIQHNLPDRGNLNYLDYFLLLAGILGLLNSRLSNKWILLSWLLLAPLPATITRDAPHFSRSIFAAGVIPLISAYGLLFIYRILRNLSRVLSLAGLAFLGGAYIYGNLLFVDAYFVHFPQTSPEIWNYGPLEAAQRAGAWNYGLREAVKSAISRQKEFDMVVVPHPDRSPYIFFLFYQSFPPALYWQEAVRYPATSEGFVHVRSFANYYFPGSIAWGKIYDASRFLEAPSKRLLLIDWDEDLPPGFIKGDLQRSYKPAEVRPRMKVWQTISYPDNTPAFRLIEAEVPANTDLVSLVTDK